MLPPEVSDNFLTDPLFHISDSIDTLLEEILSDDYNPNNTQLTTQNSADRTHFLDPISHTHFSISSPSHKLETLSLSHQQQEQNSHTQLANLQNSCNLANGFESDSCSVSEIKSEDSYMGFNSTDCNMHNFQGINSVANETTFSGTQIRRVYSTGNFPELRKKQMAEGSVRVSSAFGEGGRGRGERLSSEEANLKVVGRYNSEERKERIDRYRAKRTQRNFGKTIKYACRKMLADSRPRVRGRFARNDGIGEVEGGSQEEDEARILDKEGEGGGFLSNFEGTHFHYYRYC